MTAVKNYLVGAHYRIKETKWAWKDTKDEGDQYELYKDRKSTRLNSSHIPLSRMPSSA